VEVLRSACNLGSDLDIPPLQLLHLFTAYGAPPPPTVVKETRLRHAALRDLIPAAAPSDLVALLHLTVTKRASPDALVASLTAASQVLQITPYRIMQMLIRDASSAAAAQPAGALASVSSAALGLKPSSSSSSSSSSSTVNGSSSSSTVNGSSSSSSSSSSAPAAANTWYATSTPRRRRRPQYQFLLMPADRLRDRADAIGELLGITGPQLSSLLRYTPRLLAHDTALLRRRMEYLSRFLTGADGGGGGSSGSSGDSAVDRKLREAGWHAAQMALRACPMVLQLDVSTCVERVRAVEAALRLQGAAAWQLALKSPQIMMQRKERLVAAAEQLQRLTGGLPEARRLLCQDPDLLVNLANIYHRSKAAAAEEADQLLQEGEGAAAMSGGEEEAGGCVPEAATEAGQLRQLRQWRQQLKMQPVAAATDIAEAGEPAVTREAAGETEAAAEAKAEPGERGMLVTLRWMADTLGIEEIEALAKAATSCAGRRLLWEVATPQAKARVKTLAGLMGLEVGALLSDVMGRKDASSLR